MRRVRKNGSTKVPPFESLLMGSRVLSPRTLSLRLGRIDFSLQVGVEQFAAEVGSAHLTPDVNDGGGDEDRGVGSDDYTNHDGEGEVLKSGSAIDVEHKHSNKCRDRG